MTPMHQGAIQISVAGLDAAMYPDWAATGSSRYLKDGEIAVRDTVEWETDE
jgi:hypothetical protein